MQQGDEVVLSFAGHYLDHLSPTGESSIEPFVTSGTVEFVTNYGAMIQYGSVPYRAWIPRGRWAEMILSGLSFECPECGMISHNPNDVAEGYCGLCHDWTGRKSGS